MPRDSCAAAASIASSSRSPGMNVDTDRRTNAVLVARSRSHALVDIASRIFRATLIARVHVRMKAGRRPRAAIGSAKAVTRTAQSATSQEALDQPAVHLE